MNRARLLWVRLVPACGFYSNMFASVRVCVCVCRLACLFMWICVCCVCPVKPRRRNWIKAEKKGPSNVSNCEVKMVVICVHGMLAGTSESANRHDFCWKLVFGLGLLSLLRLLKIFDCHFARYDSLRWNFMLPPPPIYTTITIYFNQTKNIYALCKFEIEIEQIKIIKQCVDTNAHCPSLCLGLVLGLLMCDSHTTLSILLQMVDACELCVQIFNTKFYPFKSWTPHFHFNFLTSFP